MRRTAPAAILAVVVLAVSARAAPRPWPDSSGRILVFADQLQESMTEAQRRFAATNLVGTQKMRRSEIRAIRAYNPDFLCLHYQLALGCGPAAFIIGDTWGSDWSVVNSHENWFLHNASSERVHQTTWNWDVMNITHSGGAPNTGFPQYWTTTCLARIRSAEDDGVFADSFTLDGLFFQCDPSHTWFEDVGACAANWVPSLNAYGNAIRAAFEADANGYLFIPNLGGLITGWDTTDYAIGHGGMVECFAFWDPGDYFDVADWRLQMDRTLALVRSNKIVLCQSYPDTAGYRDRMFAVASYLLIKGSRTYISLVAEGGLEYYPEYTINLGAAAAAATVAGAWHAPWGVYRRDFANGLVLVNPGASVVNIASLGTNYFLVTASGGGAVNASGGYGGSLATSVLSSLNMPAHSGAVLLHPGGAAPPPPPPAEVNLALAARGSTITGSNGTNWSRLIDGITNSYTKTTGYGLTYWKKKPNSPGAMTLALKGPCTINRLRLLLWNKDSRYSRYRIEASLDGLAWTPVVDRTAGKWRGWQDVMLATPFQARYLRLTGTYCSDGKEFRVVEWEVYGTADEGAVAPPWLVQATGPRAT